MAITKIWGVTKTVGKTVRYISNEEKTESRFEGMKEGDTIPEALEDVIAYASNAEKTEKCFFVNGVNCNPETAPKEFNMIKTMNKKRGSKRAVKDSDGNPVLDQDGKPVSEMVEAYHCVMSFDGYECSPEVAHEIGLEFAKRAWGDNYQVVVATHLNTENVHNHFVVNSVGLDGKLLHDGTTWWKLKRIADELCKEYGLSVVNEPLRGGEARNWKVQQDNKSGQPTRYNFIKEVLDEALDTSLSLEEFERNLKKAGFMCKLNPDHKYWTVTPKGYKRPVRTYHIGDAYTKQAIIDRLEENKVLHDKGLLDPEENKSTDPFEVWSSERAMRYRRKTKKGSYMYLWYYSCYMYGFVPTTVPKMRPKYRTPIQLQKNYINIPKLNEEALMLAAYQIETFPQLVSFRDARNKRMEELSFQRDVYRKQARKADVDSEDLKEKISDITKEMREIRHELKMIDDVDKRAGSLAEALEQLDLDMEKVREERFREEKRDG